MSCGSGPHPAGDPTDQHGDRPPPHCTVCSPMVSQIRTHHPGCYRVLCRHQDGQHMSLVGQADGRDRYGSVRKGSSTGTRECDKCPDRGGHGRQTARALRTRPACSSLRPGCRQRGNSQSLGWLGSVALGVPSGHHVELACGQWGMRGEVWGEADICIAQHTLTM